LTGGAANTFQVRLQVDPLPGSLIFKIYQTRYQLWRPGVLTSTQ